VARMRQALESQLEMLELEMERHEDRGVELDLDEELLERIALTRTLTANEYAAELERRKQAARADRGAADDAALERIETLEQEVEDLKVQVKKLWAVVKQPKPSSVE
jgi:hypothetical protein